MNHAKRTALEQTRPHTRLACGSAVARVVCQRIELGGWRVTIWQDDPVTDTSRQSFWRTPGLYTRRLARSR